VGSESLSGESKGKRERRNEKRTGNRGGGGEYSSKRLGCKQPNLVSGVFYNWEGTIRRKREKGEVVISWRKEGKRTFGEKKVWGPRNVMLKLQFGVVSVKEKSVTEGPKIGRKDQKVVFIGEEGG